MTDLVIETQELTKRYGAIAAVDRLSLQVPRGGVFGLLGPNGSGKSTTIGMLLGLVRPTSGRFRLFGQDVTSAPEASLKRIGAVVETPAFYPYMSGRANLRYFQALHGRGRPDEIDRLLDLVDLSGRANSKFSTYSLGMKQRLGIAYVLLGDPELVFLDEPTNGLDPAGMAEVRDLIRTLAADGRTVLLSSHLLHEVEQVCASVAILFRGRLIAQGRVKDLLSRQGGALRLRTTDDRQASTILAILPWVLGVEPQGEYLRVSAPLDRAWEITAALADKGVYLIEMVHEHVSLEAYFMEVTGETSAMPVGTHQ